MIQEPQRVAVPALLRQGMTAYREMQGEEQKYRLTDNWKGFTFEFEIWQFFVLDVLPGCDDFDKLSAVFKDRFGRSITREEVEELFSLVADLKLFGKSADSHPMVADFLRRRGIRLEEEPAAGKTSESGGANEALEAAGGGSSTAVKTVPGEEGGSTASKPKKPFPGVPDGIAGDSTDFRTNEFVNQKKDIAKLCEAIKKDGYELGEIDAPENTVEWLNAVLRLPGFFDKVAARKRSLTSKEELKTLKEQTAANRSKYAGNVDEIDDIDDLEKKAIKKLNRSTMELAYPREAPKTVVFEDTAEKKGWDLFNPTPLIKLLYPVLSPLRYVVYVLPVMIFVAIVIALRNDAMLQEDINYFMVGMKFSRITYATHSLIGLITDNLFATLSTALVAYSYRAKVYAFYLELHMGFFPRFHVRVGNTSQLSRRQKIWLYSAPILVRLAVISICMFLWYGTRDMGNFISPLALIVSAIIFASLFLAANPLIRSSGYNLLSVILNEPALRSKAYLSIVNKFRGNTYRKVDNNALVAYGLASVLFMVSIFALFILLFGNYVKMHFGGAGVLLTVLIILLLILRLSEKIRKIGEVYELSAQFERWRNTALPKVEEDVSGASQKTSALTYVNVFIAALIIIGLVVPYHYQPGGNLVILPNQKAELSAQVGGIVQNVYFNGGEFVKKGTVVARLDSSDDEAKVKMYSARVAEQKAVVRDLKSRPKPQDVQLAQQELKVQITRSRYSGEKLKRYQRLYKTRTVSFEELVDQQRQHEVDLQQVEQAKANLSLVEAGVTADKIAAAEEKLQGFRDEVNYYRQKVKQSVIYMPFDGRLEGVDLEQRVGHYLKLGEPFAVAENTDRVYAEVDVPEPDIGYVKEKAVTTARPYAYYDQNFDGWVKSIDTVVTKERSGNVVKVLTVLRNKNGLLQSGMTGYAKISGKVMPAWKVMSMAIVRFFKVDVWSWIP